MTVLRTLAATCEFETLQDGLISDRIVCGNGIRNQMVKERLLRETELTLQKAIDICRAADVSRQQVKTISNQKAPNIDVVRQDYKRANRGQQKLPNNHKPERQRKQCGNCGRSHEAKRCPAYGKPCNKCHKLGHFAKLCGSKPSKKPVHEVDYESESDASNSSHGIDMVNNSTSKSDITNEHARLMINNKRLNIKLDTGVETNIITKQDFNLVVPRRQRASKLKPSKAKLTAYGGHNIPVASKCHLKCEYKGTTQVLEFQVVDTGKSLLGCASCKSMNIDFSQGS